MGRRSRTPFPRQVTALRSTIDRWRRQRFPGRPMPEDLWTSAVALVQSHGIALVARGLRVDYGALKKRVARLESGARTVRDSPRFVELDPGPMFTRADPGGMVVELSDAEGSRLVVRLPVGDSLDVRSLAEAFWRRSR